MKINLARSSRSLYCPRIGLRSTVVTVAASIIAAFDATGGRYDGRVAGGGGADCCGFINILYKTTSKMERLPGRESSIAENVWRRAGGRPGRSFLNSRARDGFEGLVLI